MRQKIKNILFLIGLASVVVMLVTFDNPKGASYGGTIAGPVFSRAASRILKYWNVPPDHVPEKNGKKK